jgi:hypothetical protein
MRVEIHVIVEATIIEVIMMAVEVPEDDGIKVVIIGEILEAIVMDGILESVDVTSILTLS